MNRRHPPSKPRYGFTLLELLTVIGIIVVLAALILGGMSYAQRKAASSRAAAEISALSNLIEAFKADFGDYPRSSDDKEFSRPTDDFIPNEPEPKNENYAPYSAFLTHHLFGGQKDIPASPNPAVAAWSRKNNWAASGLSTAAAGASVPDQEGNPTSVSTFYLIDPFGNAYGYSTKGKFNPSFELWSFAGEIPKDDNGKPLKYSEDEDKDKGYVIYTWIKNW
ncbi:MAG TPA: prepilin-type N-terminal cleavage/methylation domain-containing protein [Chthoniobacteraceae bacterium]|nr:prepilin-type N-terminal cleavage/methylation domain-containing protein [Chthoniobacteraceae bacterium]